MLSQGLGLNFIQILARFVEIKNNGQTTETDKGPLGTQGLSFPWYISVKVKKFKRSM